jgi:uncharacterized protein (TIGR02271 family)
MDQTQTYSENQTIVGYFDSYDRAERALDELKDAGFTSAHLGMAHRGGSARSKAASATGKAENTAHNVWEKVKDFFEGRSPENYADERTRGDAGTREITDPDTSTNASYGTSSAYDRDDLHHSLTGMNVPEHRSRYFSRRFDSSNDGCVITVNASGRAAEAERILRDNGADLGDTASETADYNTTDYSSREYAAPAAGAYAANEANRAADSSYNPNPDATYDDRNVNRDAGYDERNVNADADRDRIGARGEGLQSIQLLGEVLRVHKDRLDRGEVVVRKDIITETQTVQVPVTREELVVERRDVAPNTPAQGNIGDNTQEIRVPLTEETASIDKGTVVREEVAVGKKPVQDVRDLSGEVRREELVVDDQTRKRAVNE